MISIIERPSPNFNQRPSHLSIDMLVLHYTGMASTEAALRRLTDASAQVSAHYLITEDGQIIRLVAEEYRAWHAGRSYWSGETDINGLSIGIELANCGHDYGYRPFPDNQIESLIKLSKRILDRHPIPAHRVLGHSDVAPDRKYDPGEFFPWQHLSRHGIGLWPMEPDNNASCDEPLSQSYGQSLLAKFGYPTCRDGVTEPKAERVVQAFQRHFCQEKVTGNYDRHTDLRLKQVIAASGL